MFSATDLIQDPILLRLIFALVILLITLFARRVLSNVVIRYLSKIKFHKLTLDFRFFDCLQKPINFLLLVSGIYLALTVSPFVYYLNKGEQILSLGNFEVTLSILHIKFLNQLYGAFFVSISTWGLYNLEHFYEQFFTELNEKHSLIDNTVIIRYLSKILRFLTITLGVIIAFIILVPQLSSVLTGVGIGGVAVAYVSKDSLSSIFSGMILLLDKPFIIGDWITVNDTDGIVEDISFRSTRIRTFSQSVVVIPNNTIGNSSIVNWSRMNKRRVSFELGVSYDTPPAQIELCARAIQAAISAHPDIETDTVLARFTSLGDYSLNIQIVYYTLKTDLATYWSIQEAVNLQILEICGRYQITIAFPTQTIQVQNT